MGGSGQGFVCPFFFLSYHKIVSEAEAGCSFAPVNQKIFLL